MKQLLLQMPHHRSVSLIILLMDNFIILALIGFVIGTCGTLIGAGGGFLLVPLLLITQPGMSPDVVTAISMAIVTANAISGSIAYAFAQRIDYKAGLLFAAFTVPGSVVGVYLTRYIPKHAFNIIFGMLLLVLAIYLFIKNRKKAAAAPAVLHTGGGWKQNTLTDKTGQAYTYSYNQRYGVLISIFVGFLSPLLGIGGGIIHVPAMVNWLQFPVHVATATSHFMLAIMSIISVAVHAANGDYNDMATVRMVAALCIGVVPGAQVGAYFSHRLPTHTIIRLLAVCITLVAVRILYKSMVGG